MNWTQPICAPCWDRRYPDRPANHNHDSGPVERCAFCDDVTTHGIYIRVDPRTVPYPAPDDD